MVSKALLSSSSQEWETPHELFARINKAYDFTLDACASPSNAKVDRFFSVQDDAFKQSWKGERVWMNPPYAPRKRGVPGQIDWVRYAFDQVQNNECETVVCLLPARTDTKLFHEYVMKASMVIFIRGRLRFVGAPASAVFPSMIVTFELYDRNKLGHQPCFTTMPAGRCSQ